VKRTKISRRSTGNQLEQARAHEQVSCNVTPPKTLPRLLTTAEAASALRVHPRTMMRLAADPKSRFPKPCRVGRIVRWREVDLLGWLGGER